MNEFNYVYKIFKEFKMKNKVLMSLVCLGLVSPLFADDGIRVDCVDKTFLVHDRPKRLYGEGNMWIYNDTGVPQTVTYYLTVCSPVNECETVSDMANIPPNVQYMSPPLGKTITTIYSEHSSVYYTAKFDVKGFKTMHLEKQCVMRVLP